MTTQQMEKCDKCHAEITMSRCACGQWFEPGRLPEHMQTVEKALVDFGMSGKDISSGDHYNGCCFVFFKGDYKKCMNVVKLIELMEL